MISLTIIFNTWPAHPLWYIPLLILSLFTIIILVSQKLCNHIFNYVVTECITDALPKEINDKNEIVMINSNNYHYGQYIFFYALTLIRSSIKSSQLSKANSCNITFIITTITFHYFLIPNLTFNNCFLGRYSIELLSLY